MKKNRIIKKSITICLLISLLYISISLYSDIEYHLEFICILFLLTYIYIKSYSKDIIQNSYEQLEILIPLINDLNIKKRLPNTRGYAASPDYLFEIKNIIKEKTPDLILEAGSGVSTIIASYSLKKYGGGKIISLDHNKKYCEQTKKELKKHSLKEYADVFHAPLKKYDNDLIWYDIDHIDNFDCIDLFIIDGPPKKSSKNARFPALPLMFDKIKSGTTIILDDARRKDEQDTIILWGKKYDCFEYEYIDTDKGLAIIRKK